MATRTITASISSGALTALAPGASATFAIISDTGAAAGTISGASLHISSMRTYAATFCLDVGYGGDTLAKTSGHAANSNTHSATVALDDLAEGLLSLDADMITLTVRKISGSGNKINFREDCTLTLSIEYEEQASAYTMSRSVSLLASNGGTRTITGTISSGANAELASGGIARFAVSSDTGPVSGKVISSASLYISSFRSYSQYFYLNVGYGYSVLAKAGTVPQNANTHSATLALENCAAGLLANSASEIVLVAIATEGTSGNKVNFRDGCTVTLSISYTEASSGGGDTGGGDEGGDTNPLEKPVKVKLSSEKSYGASVVLSWEYHGTYASLYSKNSNMLIEREYSPDGITWESAPLFSGSYHDVKNESRPNKTNKVPPFMHEWTVSPPAVLWAYYRYRISVWADGCSRMYSDYSPTLQYVRPVLLEYTDNPIVSGITKVKAVHMLELQTNINRIREAEELAAYPFAAIAAGYTSLAGWSAHIAEMRAAIDEMAINHEAWIDFDINQPRADVIMQLREVVAAL